MLRLQPYRYRVVHISGSTNIADSLSRLLSTQQSEKVQYNELHDYVMNIARLATPASLTTREIERASNTDSELINLRQCISTANWSKLSCRQYLPIRNELTSIGCIILRDTRIVIPTTLRERVLALAHEGHTGIVVMKRRLRSKVWWPNLDRDAERFCKMCFGCQLVSNPFKPEPMKRTEMPKGPWQDITIDIFGPIAPFGNFVFVAIDYYSRYFEIEIMKTITSQKIIASLTSMFVTHGLPLSITSDNGPQFIINEFESYLALNDIKHRRVTPLWPQANGEVEIQNRALLKRFQIARAENKNWKDELNAYLLKYRTTPHSTTGISPAELMFNRKIRSKLPEISSTFDAVNDESVRDRDAFMKDKGRVYSDKKRGAIRVGDKVLLKQSKNDKVTTNFAKQPFTMVSRYGNSVVVKNENGRYKRNITYAKKLNHAERNDGNATPNIELDNDETNIFMPSENREKRKIKPPKRFNDYV